MSSADISLQERINMLTEESGSVSHVYVYEDAIVSPRMRTVVIILLITSSAQSVNMGL